MTLNEVLKINNILNKTKDLFLTYVFLSKVVVPFY